MESDRKENNPRKSEHRNTCAAVNSPQVTSATKQMSTLVTSAAAAETHMQPFAWEDFWKPQQMLSV